MNTETKPGELKRALRSELIAARARLSKDDRHRKSQVIAERLDALPAFASARVVALYAPLGTEVDALQIARRAELRGVRVVYPRAVPGERRLVFARCEPGALVRGSLGAGEPPGSAPVVDLREVECVVLPGVAFSTTGVRLGRGGGYYDATLKAMPWAARVGIGFDLQLVETLPREAHDAPLDAVVTESQALRFEREPSPPGAGPTGRTT